MYPTWIQTRGKLYIGTGVFERARLGLVAGGRAGFRSMVGDDRLEGTRPPVLAEAGAWSMAALALVLGKTRAGV